MSNSFSHSKSRYVTKNQGDVVAQDYGLNSQQKSKSYFKSYSKSYSKSYGKSIKDTIIVSSHKNTTYNEDAKDNDPKNNDSKILLENKIDEDVCKDINEDINEDIDEDVIDIEDNIVEVFDDKTVPIKIKKDDTFLQSDAVEYFADEPRHKFYVESLREVEHRLDTEIENEEDTNVNHNSNHNSNHKINSYLLSLENRYTDQTPHKISNSMYSIGLDLSVSSYKKSKITKKIEEALQIGIRELDYDNLLEADENTLSTLSTLDEVRSYHKKKLLEYIKIGIRDGCSTEYYDTFHKVYENKTYELENRFGKSKKNISTHLGSMFTKYTDCADPRDVEQMYNVGILVANIPFNRSKMISKLKTIIDNKSKDNVSVIQQNKREQLLTSMDNGYTDSMNPQIRYAYDTNGTYNYEDRELLRKRAWIDAVIRRSNH